MGDQQEGIDDNNVVMDAKPYSDIDQGLESQYTKSSCTYMSSQTYVSKLERKLQAEMDRR